MSRLPLRGSDRIERTVREVVIQPLPVLGDALKAHPEAFSHSAAGDVVGGRLEYEAVEAEVVEAVLH